MYRGRSSDLGGLRRAASPESPRSRHGSRGGEATMRSGMRELAAIGLLILFVIGAVLGLVIGLGLGVVSWLRAARAVHAEGVVCRARLTSRHVSADLLAGPALVRLSGA